MKGKITEIFESIQGEGLYFGERQLFVRLFGCNLSCKFCDTKLDNYREYEAHALAEDLRSLYHDHHSVSFTGGEPLLQKDFLKEVLYHTHCYGFRNYLETNGTLPDELFEVIKYVDIVAMDLKLPSSAGIGRHYWQEHRSCLKIARRKQVFLKSVICSSTSEEDLQEAIRLIKEIDPGAVLVLQPDSHEMKKEWRKKLEGFRRTCEEEGVTACIIPQLHKMMGIR